MKLNEYLPGGHDSIKASLDLPTSFAKTRFETPQIETKPVEKVEEKKPTLEKPQIVKNIEDNEKAEKIHKQGYGVVIEGKLFYSVDGKNKKIDLHQMQNGVFEFDKNSQEKTVIQTEKGVFVLENGKIFDVAEYHKNLVKDGLNGLNYTDALLVETYFEKLKRKNIVDFDDFTVQTKLIKSLIALGKYNVASEGMKSKILEFIVGEYNDVAGIFEKRHSPYKFELLKGKEGYGEVRGRVVGVAWVV